VKVDYRQGDMRQINFLGEFDRVVLLFTSFGFSKMMRTFR